MLSINNVSALDYSSNVGIGFTFNPTLSISLSSSDLVIPNLIPGSTLDSNSINVSVATNAAYGYTLSTTVGNSLHNNTNLTHTNSTNIFSSIATDADLPSLTTDNTWGYNTSLDGGSTWSNYNGLSNSSNTTLLDKDSNISSSIDFRIGAKASPVQSSGTYTNTITFTAVTKPTPMNLAESYFAHGKTRYNGYYTMQDMTTEICNDTEVIGEGSQTQLIDIRDNKVYWATKLADGHCWMTQNLDLDLAHNKPLTSEDTDLNDNSLSGIYSENYKYNSVTRIITWTPVNTTRDYTNNTGTAWSNNNNTAYSLNPGEWYWSGNDETLSCDYITDTCENFSQIPYDTTGAHGHVGNYYNWPAVIASDDSSSLDTNTYNNITDSPKNSICPRGWRLPIISAQSNTTQNSTNEFGRLNYLYNSNDTKNDINLITAPLWFVRSNYVNNGSISGDNSQGEYWSSTVENYQYAYNLSFRNDNVNPASRAGNYRRFGRSVRCLVR